MKSVVDKMALGQIFSMYFSSPGDSHSTDSYTSINHTLTSAVCSILTASVVKDAQILRGL
jgi:hypothetical protein